MAEFDGNGDEIPLSAALTKVGYPVIDGEGNIVKMDVDANVALHYPVKDGKGNTILNAGQPFAPLVLNFEEKKFYLNGAQYAYDELVTHTRGTEAYYTTKDGFLAVAAINEPRFDWATGRCGLLVEPQRTNLLIYSEQFASSWTPNVGATITSDTLRAPTGENTAEILDMTASQFSGMFEFGIGTEANTKYGVSYFIKHIEGHDVIKLGSDDSGAFGSSGGAQARYNYGTDSFTNVGSQVAAHGSIHYADGWRRVWLILETVAGDTNTSLLLFNASTSETARWGFFAGQLEKGDTISSPIKTSNVSATRDVDDIKLDGDVFTSFYNASEGTMIVDFYHQDGDEDNQGIACITDGSYDNVVGFIQEFGGSTYRGRFATGGASYHTGYKSVPSDTKTFAIAYKANDNALYQESSPTSISSQMPGPIVGADRLLIGSGPNTDRDMKGVVYSLSVLSSRLRDSYLEEIPA